MPEATEIVERMIAKRDSKRERNRKMFPTIAAFVDLLNNGGLGPVKVLYAKENENETGTKPADWQAEAQGFSGESNRDESPQKPYRGRCAKG